MPCDFGCNSCATYMGTCPASSSITSTCKKGTVQDSEGNCIRCPKGCTECTLTGNYGFKCQACYSNDSNPASNYQLISTVIFH